MKASCFGLKYFVLNLKFPQSKRHDIMGFAAQPQNVLVLWGLRYASGYSHLTEPLIFPKQH